jgi:hypothetical protein
MSAHHVARTSALVGSWLSVLASAAVLAIGIAEPSASPLRVAQLVCSGIVLAAAATVAVTITRQLRRQPPRVEHAATPERADEGPTWEVLLTALEPCGDGPSAPDVLPVREAARQRVLARLTVKVGRLVNHAADAVRDAILDLDWQDPDRQDGPRTVLPPVTPEQFAVALHGRVEEVVRHIAEAVNASADGRITAATEEHVQGLLAELGCEALGLGLHLRVAAAEACVPADQLGPGKWASHYRRIKAAEGRWPAASA